MQSIYPSIYASLYLSIISTFHIYLSYLPVVRSVTAAKSAGYSNCLIREREIGENAIDDIDDGSNDNDDYDLSIISNDHI